MNSGSVSAGRLALLPVLRSDRVGGQIGSAPRGDMVAVSAPGPGEARRLRNQTVASLQRIADGLNRMQTPRAAAGPIERLIHPQDLGRVALMDTVLQEFKGRFPLDTGRWSVARQANDQAFRLKVELVGASLGIQRAQEELGSEPAEGVGDPLGGRAAVERLEAAVHRLLAARVGIDALSASLANAIRVGAPPGFL